MNKRRKFFQGNKDMRKLLYAVGVLALAGCAATARVAVLQNPETKQTVECKIIPAGGMNWTAQVDNCIAAYKKAGYVVVADTGASH